MERNALKSLAAEAIVSPPDQFGWMSVSWHGDIIGKIRPHHRTMERATPGKMVVNSRWKQKRRSWVADYPGVRNPYRWPFDTRWEAVADIIEHTLRARATGANHG